MTQNNSKRAKMRPKTSQMTQNESKRFKISQNNQKGELN